MLVAITAIIVACVPAYIAIMPQLKKKSTPLPLKTKPKLVEHSFFYRSEATRNQIQRTFSLDNKGKEVVFKDILNNQILIYQRVLVAVCRDVDEKKILTSAELYNAHIEAFDRIQCEHYTYHQLSPMYSTADKRVLDRVMKRYSIWQEEEGLWVQDTIEDICHSPYYDDIQTQAAVVMDAYLSILTRTLREAQLSLSTVNGDLKGLVFRGVEI